MSVNATLQLLMTVINDSTTNTAGKAKEIIPNGDLTKYSLSDGTGVNQASKVWSYTGSLAATSITYDLTSLTGVLGTVSFSTIKMIYISNNGTTDGQDLTVGNATTAPFSGWLSSGTTTEKVRSNGFMLKFAPGTGLAVSVGTSQNLKIDAGANTLGYTIICIGT